MTNLWGKNGGFRLVFLEFPNFVKVGREVITVLLYVALVFCEKRRGPHKSANSKKLPLQCLCSVKILENFTDGN